VTPESTATATSTPHRVFHWPYVCAFGWPYVLSHACNTVVFGYGVT